MYLSKLILNPRSRPVQRDLARPHDLHRTILGAFPDDLDKAAERVLYRLDQTRGGELHLLVQSHLQPNWSGLMGTDYLWAGPDNPALKEVEVRVQVGQQLAFRLRANPTKRMGKSAAHDKGKRVGLYKLEEQVNWLQRKAADHGFAIGSVMPTQQQRTDDNRQNLKFLSVQFDGVLQVTDTDKFLTAIQSGIGSGKAFGFGLLSVAPVR
ncbi:MAG: type I-E CRISPR-associated protein Cas6/Cse3/CasE [Caldilineaceae bacterium]